jgi:hypothetical protein
MLSDMRLDGITHANATQKGGDEMADEQTPRLHAEIVQGISKAGNRYECIEVLLDGMSIGRIFPSKLEMAMIKQTLGI